MEIREAVEEAADPQALNEIKAQVWLIAPLMDMIANRDHILLITANSLFPSSILAWISP